MTTAGETSLIIRAGPRARALIAAEGLQAADVAAIPAAAGGPKGLALNPLDRWLFGQWLTTDTRDGTPRLLIGSSVGAWRMAAAAQHDADAALTRMCEGYFGQRYPKKPDGARVAIECGKTADAALGPAPQWDATRRLVVVTARSRGPIVDAASKGRLAGAAFANAIGRARLARWFERVIFTPRAKRDAAILQAVIPRDPFGAHLVEFGPDNARDALLASGTIPLLADPVKNPAGAPPGLYWDGGMVDYHLDWNWQALDGVVLYPHFTDHVVPGWLDKHLPWRRARGRHLDNLVIVAPSKALLARLPRGKLPDRQDFYHYGLDYDARIAAWRRAIGECARMADDFAAFVARPDPRHVLPLA